MRKHFLYIMVKLLALLACGCSGRETSDPAAYNRWISDPSHGLVQTRYIHGVKLTLKYLPPEYLAYSDLKRNSLQPAKGIGDSLRDYYSKSVSFMLTLGPDDRKKSEGPVNNDIMFLDVTRFEEYKDRSFQMNFDMADYVSLKCGAKEVKPVLTNMENVYGLSPERNIHLVFPADRSAREDLEVVFNDELFNTGINHFVITRKQLNSIPNFVF